MSLETTIMADLKEAMKSKDDAALRSIRSIKAALLLLKTDGSGQVIDEAREVSLLQKLIKQRQDSIAIYEQQGRTDLATTEKEEIAVIQKYLPKMMDEGELRAALQVIITEVGATSAKDMGKVMGVATKQFAGKADGRVVSAMVKELLG
jgi:hypothetical protein